MGAVTTGESSSDGEFKLAGYIKEAVDNGDELKIRLSYHDPSLAFAVPIRQGMERAAAELGVNVQMIGPSGGDASAQVAELQTLINQKQIHGLAVSSASNDALKPVIAQAFDAGIPIISFNTNNPESKQMGFVGQDLVASASRWPRSCSGCWTPAPPARSSSPRSTPVRAGPTTASPLSRRASRAPVWRSSAR